MLKLLNKEVVHANPWAFTFIMYVLLAFFFDIYLLVFSENRFLTIISIICLFVSVLGAKKSLSEEFSLYFLVYLTPTFLICIGAIPMGEYIGINSTEYFVAAYATAGSALFPTLATLVTVPIVLIIGWIFRLFDKIKQE